MSAPKQPSLQLRLTILLVVVACLFAALFARLWFLQVMNAPKAQAAAENNGIRLVYSQAPRGSSRTATATSWSVTSTSPLSRSAAWWPARTRAW